MQDSGAGQRKQPHVCKGQKTWRGCAAQLATSHVGPAGSSWGPCGLSKTGLALFDRLDLSCDGTNESPARTIVCHPAAAVGLCCIVACALSIFFDEGCLFPQALGMTPATKYWSL